MSSPRKKTDRLRPGLKRTLLLIGGIIATIFAAIGALLPIIPTTPFLIVAAGCFAGSRPEWVDRLERNRLFGPYIEAYRKDLGITIGRKTFAISVLWIALITSMVLTQILPLALLLIAIGTAVTIHLLRFKTRRD